MLTPAPFVDADFARFLPVFTCSLCGRIVRDVIAFHCDRCSDFNACGWCVHRYRKELVLGDEDNLVSLSMSDDEI